MLGKLMKHEFRATRRIMLPLIAAELLLAVLAGFSVRGLDKLEDMGFLGTMYVMLLVLFFLGMFAVGVVALVIMIQRFYKNLLRDEGYLSMTLPVSVDAHIWAKLLVSFVWFLAVGLLFALGMAVMLIIGSSFSLSEVLNANLYFYELRDALREIGGGNIALFLFECLVLFFLGTLASCLRCYSAMAIGCSAANHKLLLSFVAYILIGIGISVIQNALVMGVLPRLDLNGVAETLEGSLRAMHGMMWLIALGLAIYSAVFYFVTRFFLRKKLNLA